MPFSKGGERHLTCSVQVIVVTYEIRAEVRSWLERAVNRRVYRPEAVPDRPEQDTRRSTVITAVARERLPSRTGGCHVHPCAWPRRDKAGDRDDDGLPRRSDGADPVGDPLLSDDLLALSMSALETQLDTSADGLTQAEAATRLAKYGPNEIAEHTTNPLLTFPTRKVSS